MISALIYLQINTTRNRLRARLRRLKNPKYLIGGIFGLGYLIFYFSLFVFGPRANTASVPGLPPPDPLLAQNFGALLLLTAVVLLGWVLPNERGALIFTEAEINFLFPAPITRPQLIHYKLVRSQIGILFSVLFLTLIWGRWRQGGHAWISMLGWWTILSTLNLHTIAASFARSMLFDHGITNLRRRIILLVGLAVVVGGACLWSEKQWPPFPHVSNFEEGLAWFKQVLSTGAMPYILYPFRLVVRPYFAPDALSFLQAFLPALAIMAAHYFIVIRANVAFEEASVEASQKLAVRISAMQERRIGGGSVPKKAKRAPFNLKPVGLPSVAFLWKNLILAGNFFSGRMFWRIAIFVVIWATIVHPGRGHATGSNLIGIFCLMFLMISLFIGQGMLRIDFRADLNMAEQLLSYPLPGWQIVLGEILAPVAILAAIQWLLILGAALFLTPGDAPDVPELLGARISVGLAAAILVPFVDAIMLIIPNAVAVVFPSWVRFDKNAPRGIENFGQIIIVAMGQILVMLVALLPAALGFFLTFISTGLLLNIDFTFPLSAAVAAGILAVEGYIAIRLLGKAFERFDLSAEAVN